MECAQGDPEAGPSPVLLLSSGFVNSSVTLTSSRDHALADLLDLASLCLAFGDFLITLSESTVICLLLNCGVIGAEDVMVFSSLERNVLCQEYQ